MAELGPTELVGDRIDRRAHVSRVGDVECPRRRRARTVEGLDYEIHCRRLGSMDAPEEVELDGNVLADGHEYFDLGFVERSPDENLLAYAIDFSGKELHQLRIRDLHTFADLDDVLENVYYGFAWAADGRTFFYVRPDGSMRPYQVWRHVLGTLRAERRDDQE